MEPFYFAINYLNNELQNCCRIPGVCNELLIKGTCIERDFPVCFNVFRDNVNQHPISRAGLHPELHVTASEPDKESSSLTVGFQKLPKNVISFLHLICVEAEK
jgi:hypothetical protein